MSTELVQKMRSLLPVVEVSFGSKQGVDARKLHAVLGVGRDFSTWIKDRIEKYDFVEKQDFEKSSIISSSPVSGSQGRIEYTLSLDMAKELAMVENNDNGRVVRRYFIECEKVLRSSTVAIPDFSNPAEAARAWADEYEKRVLAEKQRDEAVETAAVAAAALGFAGDFVQVKGLPWVTKMFTPSGQFWARLGKFIAKLSRETCAEVKQVVDPTFGYVNAYRREVCDQAQRYLADHPEVFAEFRK